MTSASIYVNSHLKGVISVARNHSYADNILRKLGT